MQYVRMASGSCSSLQYIQDKGQCQRAANMLGLQDTTAASYPVRFTNTTHPYGCYFKRSTKSLYWSSSGDKHSNDKDLVSLCTIGKNAQHPRPCNGVHAQYWHDHSCQPISC